MSADRAKTVLEILKQTLDYPNWAKSRQDPFETLVATVISQNTADRNTAKAFERLSNRFEIAPKGLSEVSAEEIEDAIKVAGLYKGKAETLKQISKIILEKYHGSLQEILSLPLEAARKTLIGFRGVGPKTADVVLLFSGKADVIPIDTHVNRVAKRLGFAPADGDYDDVRLSLQALFDRSDFLAVHLLFIAHGQKTCKAPRPLCSKCPVNEHCPSAGKWVKS